MAPASGKSLLVKLPYRFCEKCTDILSRWFEPALLNNRMGGYYDQWSSTYDEKHFEQNDRNKSARWTWKVCVLKTSAHHCRFCRFVLASLDASPWMQYQDESFVELTPSFVGSKHTTPVDRSWDYIDQGTSSYDRYYRPQLRVFNKNFGGEKRPYVAGDFTYIFPLATSRYDWEESGLSQAFNGRVVRRTANFELLQYWYKVCCTKHIIQPKPRFNGRKQSEQQDCRPKAFPDIPHFRLVDVESRSVVEVELKNGLEYAALSYVWGNAKRLLLRSDNLEELSTPDALTDENEDIPKTFIDAFEIAERLHIRYLWIDALCILQDNTDQLLSHMNSMDSIYSSASLTIVSDTESADTGIPGISVHRSPHQATFCHGGKEFLSSKRTFGTALRDSYWESRAWCLQEKVFSKRLLIFTPSQTFYHCTCATWFEDTILESKERDFGNIYIAERSDPGRKRHINEPSYTAYEAHRSLFSGRNFWSLVEIYSRRQISFESDSIRAFSGILKSIEEEYGTAIWGVPQYSFARGLTWSLSGCKMSLRRLDFPSWAWAGWNASDGARLHFTDVLIERVMPELWALDFYYYCFNERTGEHELTLVDKSNDPDFWGKTGKERARIKQLASLPPPTSANPFAPPPEVTKDKLNIRIRSTVKSLPKANTNQEGSEVIILPSPVKHTGGNPFAPKESTYPSQVVVVDEAQISSISEDRLSEYSMENTTNEQPPRKPSARPILSKIRDAPPDTGYDSDGAGDLDSMNSDGSIESLKYATYFKKPNDIIDANWPRRGTTQKFASSATIRADIPSSVKIEHSLDAESPNDDVEVIECSGSEDLPLGKILLNDPPSESLSESSVIGTTARTPSRFKRLGIKSKDLKTSPSLERFINDESTRKTTAKLYDARSVSPSLSSWSSSESLGSRHHNSISPGPKLQYTPPPLLASNSPLLTDLVPPKSKFSRPQFWTPYRKWKVPGHPGESDHSKQELPPLQYDSSTMPPLSHILRFYTSVATLYIETEPDAEYYSCGWPESSRTEQHNFYALRLPQHLQTSHEHEKQWPWGHIELPPDWDGKGKEAEFLYISTSFDEPDDAMSIASSPEPLNVILVERMNGGNCGDVVYRKVTMCGRVDMEMWRSAKPVWRLVNLA